jgi:hypothetical protein
MIVVVGVLLVVLAGVLLAGLVLAPGGSTQVDFYGLILPNLSARTLVLAGLAAGLLLALGALLVRTRIAHWSRRRRTRRHAASRAPVGAEGLGNDGAAPTPAH